MDLFVSEVSLEKIYSHLTRICIFFRVTGRGKSGKNTGNDCRYSFLRLAFFVLPTSTLSTDLFLFGVMRFPAFSLGH